MIASILGTQNIALKPAHLNGIENSMPLELEIKPLEIKTYLIYN
jgi:hypothetical protein